MSFHISLENNQGETYEFFVTEGETDQIEAVGEYCKDLLWSFNPEFLEAHMISEIDAKAIEKIQPMYEDANPILKNLIIDWEDFIEDAIRADGAGHFLSPYDGEELYVEDLKNLDFHIPTLIEEIKEYTEEKIENLCFYQV